MCTRRAALNMAYQEMLKSGKSVEPIAELPGVDLMGAQLKGKLITETGLPLLTRKTCSLNKASYVS